MVDTRDRGVFGLVVGVLASLLIGAALTMLGVTL
jgi:hypothetical protein